MAQIVFLDPNKKPNKKSALQVVRRKNIYRNLLIFSVCINLILLANLYFNN